MGRVELPANRKRLMTISERTHMRLDKARKNQRLDDIRCAVCGRTLRWKVRRGGGGDWFCDKCECHTSVGIEAAEEE